MSDEGIDWNEVFEPERDWGRHSQLMRLRRKAYLECLNSLPASQRPNDRAVLAWLEWSKLLIYYPIYSNTVLTIHYLFQELEEGDDPDPLSWQVRPPYAYFDRVYFKMVYIWERCIQEWAVAIHRDGSVLRGYDFKLVRLRDVLEAIEPMMEQLSRGSHDPNERQPDNSRLRAATLDIDLPDMEAITTRIQRSYDRFKSIESALEGIVSEAKDITRETHIPNVIRRRRAERGPETVSSSTGESPSVPMVQIDNIDHHSSSKIPTLLARFPSLLIAIKSRISQATISQQALRRALLGLVVAQPTLWTLAIATGILSAITATVSTFQSRPAACMPSFSSPDDSTWALVAQVPVQLFSLYTTLLPIIKDERLSVRPFWFTIGLSLSAVMTIVSPVIYGSSWRASTLLTYFASVFAMICSTQLASSILISTSSVDLAR